MHFKISNLSYCIKSDLIKETVKKELNHINIFDKFSKKNIRNTLKEMSNVFFDPNAA